MVGTARVLYLLCFFFFYCLSVHIPEDWPRLETVRCHALAETQDIFFFLYYILLTVLTTCGMDVQNEPDLTAAICSPFFSKPGRLL